MQRWHAAAACGGGMKWRHAAAACGSGGTQQRRHTACSGMQQRRYADDGDVMDVGAVANDFVGRRGRWESIGKSVFVNRAACKMANMDKIFGFTTQLAESGPQV